MPETYTSGVWLAKEGEEDEFVAAWTEFVQWASRHPAAARSDSFVTSRTRLVS